MKALCILYGCYHSFKAFMTYIYVRFCAPFSLLGTNETSVFFLSLECFHYLNWNRHQTPEADMSDWISTSPCVLELPNGTITQRWRATVLNISFLQIILNMKNVRYMFSIQTMFSMKGFFNLSFSRCCQTHKKKLRRMKPSYWMNQSLLEVCK